MMRVRVGVEKNIKSVAGSNMHLVFLVLSALLLASCFGPQQWWFPAWVSCIPLFLVLEKASSLRRAFRDGFLFGCVFFVFTIFWLVYVASVGMLAVVAYCALYYAVAGAAIWWLVFRPDVRHAVQKRALFFIPLIFVVCDFSRARMPFLGFNWAFIGNSQTTCMPVLQLAQIAGAYGITYGVVLVNVLLFLGIRAHPAQTWKKRGLFFLASLSVCAGALWCGTTIMNDSRDVSGVERVCVIQPNIPQEIKWAPEARHLVLSKITTLIELGGRDIPDVIILPEAVYPGNLVREFEQSEIKRISEKVPIPLVLGAPFVDVVGTSYNSVYSVSNGQVLDVHHKLQLVPFGEFVPFKAFFALFGLDKVAYSLGVGDFRAGEEYTLFPLTRSAAQYGVMVCFEDTIPSIARTFVDRGASLLVNITNDAWFSDTRAPYQHMQASVMRAVENGVSVVRAANTGVSCVISPNGGIVDMIQDSDGKATFVDGVMTTAVPISQRNTWYRRGGFLFPWVVTIVLLIALFSDAAVYIRKRV